MGIIAMILTLQGLGLGTYAAGVGAKSLLRKMEEQNRRRPIKVKELHHGWSVQVKEAYYDTIIGRYYGVVRCLVIDRYINVYGSTEEELRENIDKAVKQLSTEYDRWKKIHLSWR